MKKKRYRARPMLKMKAMLVKWGWGGGLLLTSAAGWHLVHFHLPHPFSVETTKLQK